MSHELFSYKRIEYIVALLLDESSELTALFTHTVLKDLQTLDFHIQCLAIGFMANMPTAEMCLVTSRLQSQVY
jgi:hypothetical protein